MSFSISDWESFLRTHQSKKLPEVDLCRLRPGDRLIVFTSNTIYAFRMKSVPEADLSVNRADRPAGAVRLNGCTFGASSTIKPDRLFCGGNLEFFLESDQSLCTTTEIKALQLIEAIGAETRMA